MSPIENLADRLKRVQSAFDAAPDEGPSQFDPPPDGDYQCLLHEFDFFEGGTPKQAFMKIRWVVVHHDEHAGRFCETVYTLEDPERIGYLRADLFKLGENTAEFDLAEEISTGALQSRLLDVPALIRVKTGTKINPKTGKPYVGVYVQQRLGDPQRRTRTLPTQGSDVPGAEGDEFVHPDQGSLDDIPFDGTETPAEGQGNQEAQLREKGCVCEEPVKVELAAHSGTQGIGHVDCPLPGHAPF